MIIIIPLGGIGERFKQSGYTVPKGLIKVLGKPILYYLLDGLTNNQAIEMVYIPYHMDYARFRFEDMLQKDYPSLPFKFMKLGRSTMGAAETLYLAMVGLDRPDASMLSLDADCFYTTDILRSWESGNKIIVCDEVQSSRPIYSYIQVERDRVIDIVEKEKVSDHACTGAYGFASFKQFVHHAKVVIETQRTQHGEYYISSVIKAMLQTGTEFQFSVVKRTHWHCLGTPLQVRQFCNDFPRIGPPSKALRICFDLDNTLVTFPRTKDDYTTVEPIQANIDLLNHMKALGHTIIIYTARRMKTHGGNSGKILRDVGRVTFDTLDRLSISYDELYFGKPHADMYIDDLAVSCFDDCETASGFYLDTVSPRDYNQLRMHTIDVYTKTSDDLSGEIYYYRNIPSQIRSLFPALIKWDVHGRWYTVERVHGLTGTSMYLSELLTTEHLAYIMESIERVHAIVPVDVEPDFPIYDNYCRKLQQRYTEPFYATYPHSRETYAALYDGLREYETHRKGKLTCIHGDAVLSNILLDCDGKIQLIDMRGKVGSTLSIYGDWLYDWAKLYQSLVGYDAILQGKGVSHEYASRMRQFFENEFRKVHSTDDWENLKLITKSLLFTLLPLHNNEKCIAYYNLIQTIP